ncbi:hypothetical protein LPJ53_004385 [Coemansia erecta]|uniref:PDZ domain-containing protein n=1 Tax=Coemansia erecta TaxID=147472 RepID=A0A9W7XXW8_9FUNG|nr:hypothetical protein LPJ53_004385 [Coemansia erecta]
MPASETSDTKAANGSTTTPAFSWDTIQDRLRESIVSIQCNRAMSFDTESAGCTNATGFVIDAEQGIILSNRHVMGAGPSYHKGVFFNNTEVFLQSLYYDPVHDFAFFRYDPTELTAFTPKAITLSPERAFSGLQFRLVGNDSNEKMSVHSGELSQLDRNPPDYCHGYNDYNTFYFQASTTSKGGSSGSPVVDIEGHAVALNAGSNKSSLSCFLLPLQRVVYAFGYVQRGEIPPRGTMQTTFKHITHVQAEKFGLSVITAASEGARTDGVTGFLTVDKILPDGPADGILQVGDIVISMDGRPIAEFWEMSDVVDAAVGHAVEIKLYREKGFKTVSVPVQDLYAITPSRVLRIGGTLLHDLSFQKAIRASAPINGVYIATDFNGFVGSSFNNTYHVIIAVNGTPTPNLEALMGVLAGVGRDEAIVLTIKNLHDLRNEVMFVARHPSVSLPNLLFTRSLSTGFWLPEPFTGMSAAAASGEPRLAVDSPKPPPCAGDSSAFSELFAQSTVAIDAYAICPADNYNFVRTHGSGVVLDKARGIVLCSAENAKNPTAMYSITFGGLVRVAAVLAYTHPLHPISFLKYDPSALADDAYGDVPVASLDIFRGSSDRLDIGAGVTVYMTNSDDGQRIMPATVLSRSTAGDTTCYWCLHKRFFRSEVFLLTPATNVGRNGIGIVCDAENNIRGIWVKPPTCHHQNMQGKDTIGLDISLVQPALESLQIDSSSSNRDDIVRVLDVEYSEKWLSVARVYGVSEEHIRNLAYGPDPQTQVFMVTKILHRRAPDVPTLEVGDIVLSVDGKIVRHMNDLACHYSRDSVDLTIVRNRKELSIQIPTTRLSGKSTDHVVCWSGTFMQKPWTRVLERANRIPSEVFTFSTISGSPVHAELNKGGFFVIAIDEQQIKTMDDVLRVIEEIKSDDAVREFRDNVSNKQGYSSGKMPGRDVVVRGVTLAGQELVGTIRTNDHYFPAWQIRRHAEAGDFWTMSAI